jgi:hypothetical protein
MRNWTNKLSDVAVEVVDSKYHRTMKTKKLYVDKYLHLYLMELTQIYSEANETA